MEKTDDHDDWDKRNPGRKYHEYMAIDAKKYGPAREKRMKKAIENKAKRKKNHV